MDITNIENEWEDLKTNKPRNSDLNFVLKELEEEKESIEKSQVKTKTLDVKDKIKGLVRSFLADDSNEDKKKSNK